MDRFAELRERLAAVAKVALVHTPTPLERMANPPAALDGVDVLLKRDDQTGLALGGNKARKLEYIIADVLAGGADTVVTWGGVQSNWCRQTAAASARVGLRPVLILLRRPGAVVAPGGNLLLDHLFGATVEVVEVESDGSMLRLAEVNDLIQPIVDRQRSAGRTPYVVPVGGSVAEGSMTRPLGAMGYVEAFLELAEQAAALDLRLESVVHATGSAGTQAGLVAGARAVSPHTRIVGISVTEDGTTLGRLVRRIANQLCQELCIPGEVHDDEIVVLDAYRDAGYGVLTPRISRAIAALARTEGVLLDPVYTGKAWVGLLDLVATGFLRPGGGTVFLHTGGTPALFSYRDQLVAHLELGTTAPAG
jgi:D-cysteine desulfhydrase family pyridoxal phosphate-dependent enzyme